MWTYEVLPLRVDIDNYLFARWHVCSNKTLLLKAFIDHLFFVLVWLRNSLWGFPQIHIHISYLGNRLLQVILIIALHDCVTSWSYQDSLMCMVLNSNLLTYAFCEVDLGYLCNIPPGNYFQYNSLSLTVEIHVCGNFVNHLHLGFCFLLPYFISKKLFLPPVVFLASCGSPCSNWYM